MKTGTAVKYARAVVKVSASRGRLEEAVRSLRDVAAFFQTAEGVEAMTVLQSSCVPVDERRALLDEIDEAFGFTDEVRALVQASADSHVLGTRGLVAIAERARAQAELESDTVLVRVRTAGRLADEVLSRIEASLARMLRRKIEIEVAEDGDLIAGLVVRAGNHVWDGSLTGRIAAARAAVSVTGSREEEPG